MLLSLDTLINRRDKTPNILQQLSGRKFFRREDIIGKTAINLAAEKIGEVKDIAYDAEGKMALVISKGPGNEEAFYSIEQLVATKDVVLIDEHQNVTTSQPKPVMTPAPPVAPFVPAITPTQKICSRCQRENLPQVKFCVHCG